MLRVVSFCCWITLCVALRNPHNDYTKRGNKTQEAKVTNKM